MFMVHSECDHPECDQVTFVDMDAFLSRPGTFMLIRNNDSEICIRKRQADLGKFNKGIKSGSVGIFADLVTRCPKHTLGTLPEEWLKEDQETND